MADIETEVLQKLRCSVCQSYLSYSPIMQKANGDSVCGRCVTVDNIEHSTMRMKEYEELASTHTFPCRYDKDGCPSKVHWEDVREHEEDCSYRPYECFMLPPGSCEWSGCRNQLMEHFTEDHPTNIMNISDEINIDLSQDIEMNILTTVFNLWFLVQIKYSKIAHKMWHTVRYIGNEKCSMLFKYSFTVISEEEDITKKKNVETQNSLYVSNDKTYEIDSEVFLKCLQIAVKVNIDKKFEPKIWKPIECTLCKKNLNLQFIRQTKDGCYCTECAPDNYIIINTSTSTFTSTFNCTKCNCDLEKHKKWLCPEQGKRCSYCTKTFTDMIYHCVNNHKSVVQSGTMWKSTISTHKNIIITGCVGILQSSGMDFFIFSALSAKKLWVRIVSKINESEVDIFKCVITVVNPETGYKEQIISKRGTDYDWESYFEWTVGNSLVETKYYGNYPYTIKDEYQLIIEITRNQ